MPSNRPDIIELPSGSALVENRDDLTDQRVFSILASSRVDARAKLDSQKNISIGASWSNAYGDAFDASVVVRSIEIEGSPEAPTTSGGTGDYIATVTYGRRRGSGSTQLEEPEPNGPPVYLLNGATSEPPVDVAASGKSITSSSEEPLEGVNGIEVDEVLTVKWWVQQSSLANLLSAIRPYTGALNSTSWQGADPKAVLCHGITHSEKAENNYWKLEGRFEVRKPYDPADFTDTELMTWDGSAWVAASSPISGWHKLVLDRGRRVKNGTDSNGNTLWKTLKDEEGNPISDPVFLDGAGGQLPDSGTPKALAYLTIQRQADFNALGI